MAEKLNGPGFGFRMAAAGEQVNTADVARQVIERLAAREDALRELLSHLQTQVESVPNAHMAWAYADARDKLAAILDGEQ